MLLNKDSAWTETIGYEKTDLKPNTEYRVSFAAKVGRADQTLSFRISGYKNGIPEDKTDVMNYIEHTRIRNTDWSVFHYDFETAGVTNAYIDLSVAAGSQAYIDDVNVEERGAASPVQNEPALSRGSQLFIKNGLQFQSWVPTDDIQRLKQWMYYPSAEQIRDLGLTAVQYNDAPNYNDVLHAQDPDLKWAIAYGPKATKISSSYFDSQTVSKHDSGKTGAPTAQEQESGYLTPEQQANLNNLVSVGFGDEEDYSDTLTQNLKDWFALSKAKYPDVLVHHNEVGNTPTPEMSLISTFNKDMLRKYVRTAKPDFITYDMYYFRENRQSQEIGGTVIPFYDDLNRYRLIASEGYDGTGLSPIPFGNYMQAWRTGPGAATYEKRGDGWYEMTESQVYLSAFANWTFGGKWMSIFRWIDDAPGYLFTDSRVDENGNPQPYHIYDQFKEMIRQSKNLGEHLVRIHNKDVVILPGQHMENGKPVQNARPEDNKEWNPATDEAFMHQIEVSNEGATNDGLEGDVFISYFEPLPGLDTKDFFTTTAPDYFMILNGLTSGDGLPAEEQHGSSYETRQQIKVTFDLSGSGVAPDQLKKVSRITGEIVQVPLRNLGDGKYEMTTVLGGGMADLYFWELGDRNGQADHPAGAEADDVRLTGDPAYANDREIRDLDGRTVSIGWIKDTYSPVPEPLSHIGFSYTKDANGKLQTMPGGQIGAYFTRLYEQNLWNRRVARIQQDSNVTIQLTGDMDWTKEQLISNIQKKKAGEAVAGMPDILIVPDEWVWNGLMKDEQILPASQFDEFDFGERKWNPAYKAMSAYNGDIYGLYAGPTMNSTGVFVNKALQATLGMTDNLMALQQSNAWDWNKLKQMADTLKKSTAAGNKYLFADTDDLFKQMIYSNQAARGTLNASIKDEFAMDSQSFKEAAALYSEWYKAGLIMAKPEGADENWPIEAFRQGKVLLLAAPYNQTVEQLRVSEKHQEATIEMQDGVFLGQPMKVPVIVDAYDTVVPAGEFSMPSADWVFLMFPKGPSADGYKALIDNPAYPVMLSSSEHPEDAAYVWNLLSEEYVGVEYTRFLKKYLNQRSNDVNTLKRIGLKEGVWDAYEGTGVWSEIVQGKLMPALRDGTWNNGLLASLSQHASKWVAAKLPEQDKSTNPGTNPGNPATNPGTNPGTNQGTNQGTNPGTNPGEPGGGTIGGGSSSVLTVQPGQIRIVDGQATVEAPTGTTEVRLPADAVRKLGENRFEVKAGQAAITLPPAVVSQLLNLLAADSRKNAVISLQFVPLTDLQIKQSLEKAQTATGINMQLAGAAYDFALSIKGQSGSSAVLSEFEQPITIRLQAGDESASGKAAIYHLSDHGRLDYIGGEYANGQFATQVNHFSRYAVLKVSKSFADVPADHWAASVIGKLTSQLIIQGTGETTFSPERSLTRAEFTALLVRALKLTKAGTSEFVDVKPSDWYAEEVAIAVKAGIVQGKSTSLFEPHASITREEMVVMTMRAYRNSNAGEAAPDRNTAFADGNRISDWAYEDVSEAASLRLIQGKPSGRFEPQGQATRAEAAQAISNFLELGSNKP